MNATATLSGDHAAGRPPLPPVALTVDLCMGAWRARDAAWQLAEALGLTLPDVADYDGSDPERVARGVDSEALGPMAVTVGHRDAALIAECLPAGAEIRLIPPRFGLPLRDENRWFLTFLSRRGLRVVQDVAPVPLTLPDHAGLSLRQRLLLALFPGPLPDPVLAASGIGETPTILLLGGRIIDQRWRVVDPASATAALASLQVFADLDPRLRLMCQVLGPAYYAEPDWLAECATGLFQAGAADLAIDVLARARSVAKMPKQAAAITLELQGCRIFVHRFAEVAAEPELRGDLPGDLRRKLAQMRAWGEMFGPEPAQGLARIGPDVARIEAAPSASTDDLFVLNIAALGALRIGDTARAMALERRIEAALDGDPENADQRAVFINAINLARLHRRQGDEAAYHRQLERAFGTSEGLRSPGEILQMNLMLAAMRDAPAARDNLLRAALAWLGLDPPEAVSVRALRAVLGRTVPEEEVDEAVSAALLARLDGVLPQGVGEIPGFAVAPVAGAVAPPSAVLLIPGAAVLFAKERKIVPAPPCSSRGRLVRRVAGWLCSVSPALARQAGGTLLVDYGLGTDLPATRAGLLELMLRHGVPTGWTVAGTITLPETQRREMEAGLRPALGAAVRRLKETDTGTQVQFRRFRRPMTFTGLPAALLVAILRDRPALLSALAERVGGEVGLVIAAARRLEAQRVLTLRVMEAPDA